MSKGIRARSAIEQEKKALTDQVQKVNEGIRDRYRELQAKEKELAAKERRERMNVKLKCFEIASQVHSKTWESTRELKERANDIFKEVWIEPDPVADEEIPVIK